MTNQFLIADFGFWWHFTKMFQPLSLICFKIVHTPWNSWIAVRSQKSSTHSTEFLQSFVWFDSYEFSFGRDSREIREYEQHINRFVIISATFSDSYPTLGYSAMQMNCDANSERNIHRQHLDPWHHHDVMNPSQRHDVIVDWLLVAVNVYYCVDFSYFDRQLHLNNFDCGDYHQNYHRNHVVTHCCPNKEISIDLVLHLHLGGFF